MIDLSQELIFSLMLRSLACGAVLGFLYEIVRIMKMLFGIDRVCRLRKIISAIYLFVTDFLFCIIAASLAILLTYNISGGVFRGCVYLCMGLGLILYRATLGKIFYKFERFFTNLLRKIIKCALKIILIPFRTIFLLFVKLYTLTIGKIIGKIRCNMIIRKEKKKKENKNQIDEALLPACNSELIEEKDVHGRKGYKKEGRISFGGRRVS